MIARANTDSVNIAEPISNTKIERNYKLMIFGNWYYDTGRHTRSDRKYTLGTIEATLNGIRLRNPECHKHMDIKMSGQEIDKLIEELLWMRKCREDNKKGFNSKYITDL